MDRAHLKRQTRGRRGKKCWRQRDPEAKEKRDHAGSACKQLQAFRSVMRMMAATRPSLNACSFVSLLQVQTKSFLAVNVFPSCSIRSSPSVIWQTMAFGIGGPAVFDLAA
jgi:hypothetical protein